jgi:hypothetical protein
MVVHLLNSPMTLSDKQTIIDELVRYSGHLIQTRRGPDDSFIHLVQSLEGRLKYYRERFSRPVILDPENTLDDDDL